MTPYATPIVIGPDVYLIDDVEERAEERSLALRDRTAHRDFSVDSNQLGIVGELAVLAYRLEVKTTTHERWTRHGRVVDADQMYDTSARAYVWCAAKRAIRSPDVYLLGWSVTQEMRSSWSPVAFTGEPRRSLGQPENAQASYQPEATPYGYDDDDVNLDEYEIDAARWDRPIAEPEDGTRSWPVDMNRPEIPGGC